MKIFEPTEEPEVSELKVVRDHDVLNNQCTENCDCADPGTGADSCRCED